MESAAQRRVVALPEHQILFTVDNIGLIRRDLKIETRRLVQPQPSSGYHYLQPMFGVSPDGKSFGEPGLWREVGPDYPDGERDNRRCRYGQPGDVLWIRETWQLVRVIDKRTVELWEGKIPDAPPGDGWGVWLRSNIIDLFIEADIRWRPSIFMPRWACGKLLRNEAVHIERLHDITLEGARAEGVDSIETYMRLWDSINRKRAPASSNPYVWVIRFSKIDRGAPLWLVKSP